MLVFLTFIKDMRGEKAVGCRGFENRGEKRSAVGVPAGRRVILRKNRARPWSWSSLSIQRDGEVGGVGGCPPTVDAMVFVRLPDMRQPDR